MTLAMPSELTIQAEPLEFVEQLPNTVGPSRFSVSDIAPEIRARLSIDLGTRVLQHQLLALPRSLHLCSQGLSYVLIGGTGTGKTYYYAGLFNELRRHFPTRYPPESAILFLTEAKLVMQTTRVFKEFGCVNVQVMGYESLRSTIGTMYVEWRTEIVDGRPQVIPIWDSPEAAGVCLICADECQKLKNEDSQTSTLLRFAARAGYQLIFSSATPFSRACHVRTIAVALQPLIKVSGSRKERLTDKLYPAWLKTITDNPREWSPADMKRVMTALGDQIIKFDAVRFAHVFKIRQIVIPFESPEHRLIYDAAFNEYQTARLNADKEALTGFAAVLVAMQKFNQKAELLRANYLARSAWQCVNSKKRPVNAIIACNYRDTMYVVRKLLIEKYHVPEELISELNGDMNAKEKQINIDRFNKEITRYIIISFRAGGTGLSLHHMKGKQYPSEIFLPPVWNSEDLVQVLGRAHRVTSLSTTYQNLIWFAGTIEEKVADKVKGKCAALKEVVGAKENWIMGLDGSVELRHNKQITAAQLSEDEAEEAEENNATADTLLDGATSVAGVNATVHRLEV